MGNKLKEKDKKKTHILLFWWHDQYKRSWSKQTQTRWKVIPNILVYCIGYVAIKDLRYVKINSVNPFYLIIGKINE